MNELRPGATDLPNAFGGGYVHHARLLCYGCKGRRMITGYPCGHCGGEGYIERGCGGDVEMDANHPVLAYCLSCGRFVPSAECTKP